MTFKNGISTALTGVDITSIDSMTEALAGLNVAQQKVALSTLSHAGANTKFVASNLSLLASVNETNAAEVIEELVKSGVDKETAKQIVSSAALSAAKKTETATTNGLNASLWESVKAKAAAMATNPITWILATGAAIYYVVKAIQKHNQAIIDANDKIVETSNTNIQSYQSEISNLESLSDKLNTARTDRSNLLSVVGELNGAIGDSTDLLSGESSAFDAASVKIQARIKDLQKLIDKETDAKVAAEKSNFENTGSNFKFGTDDITKTGLIVNLKEAYSQYSKIKNQKQELLSGGTSKSAPMVKDLDKRISRYKEIIQEKVDQAKSYFEDYIKNQFSDEVSQGYANQYISDLIFGGDTNLSDIKSKLKNIEPTIQKFNDLKDQLAGAKTKGEQKKAYSNIKDFINEIKSEYPEATGFIKDLESGFSSLTSTIETSKKKSALSLSSEFGDLSKAKESLSSLDEAFTELQNNKKVTFDTLSDIQSKFAKVDGIKTYIETLSSAKKNTSETAKVLNALTYDAIASAMGSTENLANADESLVASMLKEEGVSNADKIAIDLIAQAKEKLALQSIVTSKQIVAFISNLNTEASAANLTTAQLAGLVSQQVIFNNTNLDISQKIAALHALGIQAGLTTAQLSSLSGTGLQRQFARASSGEGNSSGTSKSDQEAVVESLWSSITSKSNKVSSASAAGYIPKNVSYTGASAKKKQNKEKQNKEKKSKEEVELYTADIDKLYKSEQRLANIQDEISKQDIFKDLSRTAKEQETNIRAEINLYKQEQAALKKLNDERTKQIKANISKLTSKGFKISYDPVANKLIIENMEHINQLIGSTREKTNEARKSAEELIKTTQTLNDDNIKGTQDWLNVTKSIKDEYSSLAEIVSNTVEKAFDKVSKILDKEKEKYETQKANLESVSSTVTSYVNDYIDSLQAQNDELDKQIALQEKLEALDKARTQRNKRIYVEGKGFQWQADQSEVSSAQEEYDSALKEYNLDKKIQELKDYAQAWQDAVDSYENSKNEALTASTLGTNWQSSVLNMDYSSINNFKTQYTGVLSQLDESVYGSIAYQIKNLDDLKDKFDESVDSINGANTDYKSILELTATFESGNYDTRLAALSTFVSNAIAEYQELANAANYAVSYSAKTDYSKKILKSNTLAEAETYALQRDSKMAGEGITGVKSTQSFVDQWKAKHGYASGGIVDYTGMAEVHGGQAAELMLNNKDVSKVYDYIHSGDVLAQSAANLLVSSNLSTGSSITPNSDQNITFNMGGVNVSGVQDVNGVADEIVKKLPMAVLQKIYSKKKRR